MTPPAATDRKQAYIDKWRHEFGGMVLDACQPRDGAHAAMFMRQILRKIDVLLSRTYDDLAASLSSGGTPRST